MPLLRPPERLNVVHSRRTARLRVTTSNLLGRAFDQITDPADSAGFIAKAVPIVLGAQTAMVTEVDVYLSLAAGIATRTTTAPIGLDPAAFIGAKARNGTVLETVYRRPLWEWERRQADLFAKALKDLSTGAIRRQSSTIDREAIRLYARTRIAQDIVTDLGLVQRDATWARMQIDPRLPRWRRVLSGESCPLCTVASTNTYAKIRRIQLHAGCDCGIEPVTDGDVMATPLVRDLPDVYRRLIEVRRPGTGINGKADLSGPVTLYPDLLNTKIADLPPVEVVQHGELGPVLWDSGHHFAA